MTPVKSSTAWAAYFIVYVLGFAGLAYLTRHAPAGWATLSLPFAFPLVLVAFAALLDRAEAKEPPPPEPRWSSLLGKGIPKIGGWPARATTTTALNMCLPWYTWMYPADFGVPSIHWAFLVWWLAWAAFVGLILPRLLSAGAPRSFTGPTLPAV